MGVLGRARGSSVGVGGGGFAGGRGVVADAGVVGVSVRSSAVPSARGSGRVGGAARRKPPAHRGESLGGRGHRGRLGEARALRNAFSVVVEGAGQASPLQLALVTCVAIAPRRSASPSNYRDRGSIGCAVAVGRLQAEVPCNVAMVILLMPKPIPVARPARLCLLASIPQVGQVEPVGVALPRHQTAPRSCLRFHPGGAAGVVHALAIILGNSWIPIVWRTICAAARAAVLVARAVSRDARPRRYAVTAGGLGGAGAVAHCSIASRPLPRWWLSKRTWKKCEGFNPRPTTRPTSFIPNDATTAYVAFHLTAIQVALQINAVSAFPRHIIPDLTRFGRSGSMLVGTAGSSVLRGGVKRKGVASRSDDDPFLNLRFTEPVRPFVATRNLESMVIVACSAWRMSFWVAAGTPSPR